MLRTSAYLTLALLAAAAAPTLAAPPVLLSDINTNITNDSSYPGSFYRNGMVVLNGQVFFLADDGIHGTELWVTDGTDSGTQLFLDLYPGPTSSNIAGFTVVHTPTGDVAYFTATHPVYGYDLWITDGTLAGTRSVTEPIPGASSLSPQSLVPLNNGVAFTGFDSVNGLELWVSDSTAAGTHVLDIYPGISSSGPSNLASAGDKVFFSAFTSAAGTEPWVTDGTVAGTRMLADISPGISSTSFTALVAIPGRAFLAAYDPAFSDYRLWTSDGTTTVPVLTTGGASLLGIQHLYAGPNFAVCETYDRNTGQYQIYRTDGTPAGTSVVTTGHITFIYGGDQPANFGDSIYLTIDQDNFGYEPWRISPSPATSYRLADIAPGFPGSYPGSYTAAPNGVYFITGLAARTLYFTDGTPGGTHSVLTTPAVPYSSGTSFAVVLGSTLFFGADDGSRGVELWRTDGSGSPGSATLVKDIKTPRASSSPFGLAAAGDRVFFAATRPDVGRELFATTPGAGDSAVLVKDLAPGPISSQSPSPANSSPSPMVTVGQRLFLRATDNAHGSEVWVSDGTDAGTTITRDINPGTTGSTTLPNNAFINVDARAVELNGLALFPAATATEGWEIWKSDGTEAGTVPLLNIASGTSSGTTGYLARLGNRAFFAGTSTTTGNELWSTDGTGPGTAIVADLSPNNGSSTPVNLTPWSGNLYFSAAVGASGRELYISNGTQAGTRLLVDLNPSGSSNPSSFTPSDNFLFFLAETPDFGRELYRTDGTAEGTIRLTDIAPGPASPIIASITNAGPLVFFAATDPTRGRELWVSDGSVTGTHIVADINPGPDWSDPNYFAKIGPGRIAFSAFTPATGYELWESDGSEVGTRMVGELAPGLKSSYPQNLFLDSPRNRLLLTADDQTTIGRELYTWPIPPHCPCDINADGQTTLQDLFSFLELYFSNHGDITGDAQTTIGDIFAFLACWFQGC